MLYFKIYKAANVGKDPKQTMCKLRAAASLVCGVSLALYTCSGPVAPAQEERIVMPISVSASSVVRSSVYPCVPVGTRLLCADGGILHFDRPPDPEETIQDVSIPALVAIVPHPDNAVQGPEVMQLLITAAFTDSTGRLWQFTQTKKVYELWEQVAENGTLYANAGERVRALCRAPVPGLFTEVRTLLSDLNCLFDGRDNRLVAIVQTECDGEYPQRALYELREKYFGVSFDLLEERTYRQNQEGHWQLVLAVRFFVDNEMIAMVGKSNRLMSASRRTLMAENPVRGYGLYLRLDPRLGTAPQLTDAKPWRAALHRLGRPPEAIDKVLAPNPYVRYGPPPG